ncbi:hypothetical protein PC128_g15689 [Phytophthora cactorum]|nr:hypothetical protein PC128_g15689 [Phytophthora cactorum]KAG4040764.1 hypothetical protein PC123_g23702 [Phytophthora cactorum]
MSSDEEDCAQKQSMALCQSWNAFVENFNRDAKAYRARITAAQHCFETFSRRHMIDRLHNEAMEAGIPCAVPFGTACSHCPPGAERLSERDVTGYTTVRVPAQLRDLRAQLERRDERRDTPSVSGHRSARAGVTPALHSGLRTPSPFPERLPSGRSVVPTYLGGEEILCNEYEDEPDLGSSSGVHSPRFARLSTESSRAHRAVVAAGAERYPSRSGIVPERGVRSAAAGAALPEGAGRAGRSDCVEHPSGAWNAGREAPRRAVGAGVDAGSDVLAMVVKMLLSVDADADQVTKVSPVVLARTVVPAGRGV